MQSFKWNNANVLDFFNFNKENLAKDLTVIDCTLKEYS